MFDVSGVTEEQLDRAEEMLGWPLPTHLRLMYRFHNGQARQYKCFSRTRGKDQIRSSRVEPAVLCCVVLCCVSEPVHNPLYPLFVCG